MRRKPAKACWKPLTWTSDCNMTRNAAAPSAAPIPAVYYDGRCALAHKVGVLVSQTDLRVLAQDESGESVSARPLAVWPKERLRLVSGSLSAGSNRRASAVPIRLALTPDDGQRLAFSRQEDRLAAAHLLGPRVGSRRSPLRWAAAAAGVWLLFAALYLLSPVIFSGLAAMMPQRLEVYLGETTYNSLMQSGVIKGVNRGASACGGLLILVDRLSAAPPEHPYRFTVEVADAGFANAFALPGGRIIVTSRLIAECSSPDELAGVLAHEMAHVTRRHGTGGLLRSYAWGALLQMLGMGQASAVPLSLLSSSFSRDDEREADDLGVLRLCGAGIDPSGMALFFERLAQSEKGGAFMRYASSHPLSAERRASVTRLAERHCSSPETALLAPAMQEDDWRALQRLSAGDSPAEGTAE